MKFLIFIFLLLSVVAHAADKTKFKEIVVYKLDNKRLYPINTYFTRGVTTVMFPGQIEGIAAGNVAMNTVKHNVNGSPSCDFLMSFQPGNYYFSIRALKAQSSGTINIVYGRKTYIIKLQENEAKAMSTVTFSDKYGAGGEDSERNFTAPSIAVLKGLLDKAKSFDVLKDKYPAAVAQVNVCDDKCISEYGYYVVTVVKSWRFDNYNSLVFMIELKNNTKKTLVYTPEKTAFSILGERLYPSLIDASGVMHPRSTTVAFFVISSTADGRKNKFAANNEWKVLINAIPKDGGVK